MRNPNRLVGVLVLVLLSFGGYLWLRQEEKTKISGLPPRVSSDPQASAVPLKSDLRASTPAKPQVVAVPQKPSPLAAFKTWTETFAKAKPEQRDALMDSGLKLAAERRSVFEALMREHPERAIAEATPYSVRRELPEAFKELVEAPISGEGNFLVLGVTQDNDEVTKVDPIIRRVQLNGETYNAYVYGPRMHQTTVFGTPINGVALGKTLAMSNGGRILDPKEAQDLAAAGKLPADPICSVSGKSVTTLNAGEWLDLGGKHFALCQAGHGLLLNQRFLKGLQNLIAPSDPGTTNPPTTGATQATVSQGTKRVLFMRLSFTDDPREPITEADSYKLFNDVNEYYRTASYNQVQMVATVTPLLVLPRTAEYYAISGGPDAVLADARTLAKASGYDIANYDLDVVGHITLPSDGFSKWCGLGFVGARGSWIQCFTPKVVAHELGHNLGLWHANASDTRKPTGPPVTNPPLPHDLGSDYGHDSTLAHGYFSQSSSTVAYDVEYGNPNDWMGRGDGIDAQFSSLLKYKLRWLSPDRVKTITASGTNRVYAFDTTDPVAGRLYALQIDKDRNFTNDDHRAYWIDHRYRMPQNPWLANGVNVYWTPWVGTVGSAQLLDMTPGTPALREDAGLVLGHTFADTQSDIFITPVAKGGEGAEEYIDVVVNIGPFPGNRAPTFTLNASSVAVAPGQTITFSADNVVDADGDGVAYRWDFSDDTFGENAATVFKQFSTVGEYVVRCEVSDMKGGKQSSHLVVRVGNPTTFHVAGRVIDQDAKPLVDVRVAALGSQQLVAFTDSDGRYTIPGLTNNSVTNTAFIYGYDTKPFLFDNPTPLSAQSGDNLDHLAKALPVVSVTAVSDASESGSSPGLFRITRTGSTFESLSVYLGVNGTAEPTQDYEPFGDVLTFDPGVASIDLPVKPVDDSLGEGRETVVLQLLLASSRDRYYSYISNGGTNGNFLLTGTNTFSVPGWELITLNGLPTWFQVDPPYILGTPAATVSIVDNDTSVTPTIQATVFDATALETGEDGAVVFLTRDSGIDTPLTVGLDFSGTAVNGVDYVKLPNSVTFETGQSLVPVVIRAINDGFVEGDETVIIGIRNSSLYVPGTNSVTVTIIDNDLPTVTVNAEVGEISEVSTNVPGVFTFSRVGDLSQPLQVNYLMLGTAVNGTDYQSLPGSIIIPAGADEVRLNVFPARDRELEPKETITLQISSTTYYNVSTPGSASIVLADSSMPTVGFLFGEGATNAMSEGGGVIQLTVLRTGPSLPAMTVRYIFGGGADAGADYSALSGSLYFTNGATNAVITLAALEDVYPEDFSDAERINVRLLPDEKYSLRAPFQFSGFIRDNDSSGLVEAFFDGTGASTLESSGSFEIEVQVSGTPQRANTPVIVEYETIGGSAVLGTDYEFTDFPGMSRGWVAFNFSPTNGDTFYLQTNLNVTVIDNDKADGDKTVVLALKYPDLVYTNIVQVTNALGKTEPQTNFLVYPTNYFLGQRRFFVLTLKDDDYNTISVTATRTNALEQGEVAGQFAFTRTGATDKAITVKYEIAGSASAQTDYLPLPSQITIPAGTNVAYLTVKPIDDGTPEPLETVVVTLSSAPQSKLDPAASRASINILDNDGGIEFAAATFTFGEKAGDVQIPVRRTGDLSLSQSVSYRILAGTATPETDYLAPAEGLLNFLPGEALKNIPIQILDDSLLETDETIELELFGRSGGVVLSGQQTATVIIQSDDSGFIFSTNVFAGNETLPGIPVTVLRVGSLVGSASVHFVATNGTAISEQDFRGIDRVLKFNEGQSNALVTVPLIDDALLEPNETINLSLSEPSAGASVSDGSIAVALIRDDEATIDFSLSDVSVAENGGKAILTVRRLGGTQHPISVQFATLNGTALSDTDYVSRSASLTLRGDRLVALTNGTQQSVFTPGDSSVQLEIPILDNTRGDGTRRFTVSLTNPKASDVSATKPSPVVLGTNAVVTVTIIDNEAAGGVDGEFASQLQISGNAGGIIPSTDGAVNAVIFQPDGRAVFGGDFTEINDFTLRHIARLTPQGLLDTGFNPGIGSDGTVLALASQADGKVYLGGTFARVAGQNRIGLARVNSEGDLDTTFDPGFGANAAVRALAVAEGGAVLVGGDFTRFDGQPHNHLVRLDESGFVDPIFGASVDGGNVNALAVQQDGKILLGGSFTGVSGSKLASLARLNADGTLDKGFLASNSLTGQVNTIVIQPDGSIVVGGAFAVVGAPSPVNLVRFTAAGAIDPSFAIGTGPNGPVRSLGVHAASGKIYVGGEFTSIDGQPRNRYARLRLDGGVDDQFVIGTGADATVRAVAVQGNSSVLIGGEFSIVNGNSRPRLARIHGDEKGSLVGVEFSTGLTTVDEGVGKVTLTVRRNGDPTIPFTVHYTTVPQKSTATAGADYVAASGTLTFGEGVLSQTFTVTINQDNLPESTESIALALDQASAGVDLGGLASSVILIQDDEVSVAFASAVYAVTEGTPSVQVSVVRQGRVNGPASVILSTANGTALAGQDYTAVTAELSFSANETNKTVLIPILDDSIREDLETFVANLSSPSAGMELGLATTTIRITDNDTDNIVIAASALVSDANGNGVIDPGELITLNVALRNAGSADVGDVVATLLAGNNVIPASEAQNYGLLAGSGDPVSRSFSFSNSGVTGGNITLVFQLTSGERNLGTVSLPLALGAQTRSFANANQIVINPYRAASPYPSVINVSGLSGAPTKVTVTLDGFSHTAPGDVDIMLVAPNGEASVIMSDAGGSKAVDGLVITLDDDASSTVPEIGPLASGTFRPVNYIQNDIFDAPAPQGVITKSNLKFPNVNPNGNWSLYVFDDTPGDSGAIKKGWKLNIVTSGQVVPVTDVGVTVTQTPTLVAPGADVTYNLHVVNNGPSVANDIKVRQSLPSGATFVSATGGATVANGIVSATVSSLAVGASTDIQVIVRFSTLGEYTGVASVSLAQNDYYSDNNSRTVKTVVQNGQPVSLLVEQVNNAVVISWPVASVGQLQSAPTLVGPWSAVEVAPTQVGSTFRVTLTPSEASRFYRLSQ